MNQKNITLASIIFNFMFIALTLYVKGHNVSQADDFIGPREEQRSKYVEIHAEYTQKNAALLDMAVQVLQSDKSSKAIARIAKSGKIPGKSNEDANFSYSSTKVKGEEKDLKGRSIGYTMDNGKYFGFDVGFDGDKMAVFDGSSLLWTE